MLPTCIEGDGPNLSHIHRHPLPILSSHLFPPSVNARILRHLPSEIQLDIIQQSISSSLDQDLIHDPTDDLHFHFPISTSLSLIHWMTLDEFNQLKQNRLLIKDHLLSPNVFNSQLFHKATQEVIQAWHRGLLKRAKMLANVMDRPPPYTVSSTYDTHYSIGQDGLIWQDEHLRGDFHSWLDLDRLDLDYGPCLSQVVHALLTFKKKQLEGLGMDGECQWQISYYPAQSSGYCPHLDASEKIKRRWTCIYYINPYWKVEDGGYLTTYKVIKGIENFNGQEKNPNPSKFLFEPLSISPIANRLTIFPSAHIIHRVDPVWSDRFAITFWIY